MDHLTESFQLASRLLYLNQQKASVQAEIDSIKDTLNDMHVNNLIASKSDAQVLFTDGEYHTIRLSLKKTGTYFRPIADYKEQFAADRKKLETKYIKAGEAEMVAKSDTWTVAEIKSA